MTHALLFAVLVKCIVDVVFELVAAVAICLGDFLLADSEPLALLEAIIVLASD